MKTNLLTRILRSGFALGAAGLLTASAWAQQASLVLEGGDMVICHKNNTEWSLTKAADQTSFPSGSGSVTWTVTVTKGATSPNSLTFGGYLRIYNGGSANATVGNIVVNLQRKSGKNWKTVSSDIANATLGDAATTAKVVAGASSEGLNTFTENAASGALEFSDANNNTLFSLSPQQVIAPGAHVDLVYLANFNNSLLGIRQGESTRLEVIVSFGNAGARGGSGATAKNMDINGNGVIDRDEANVRSVPSRITKAIPALEECNKTVTLTDPSLEVTGTASASNVASTIGDGLVVSASSIYTVSADLAGGASGGKVCNTAFLDGANSQMGIIIGYTTVTNEDLTVTQVPVYRYFPCCVGAHLKAESCVDVGAVVTDTDIKPGDFTGFTQGGWGATPNGNNPGTVLHNNFATVFPSGVEIGVGGAGFSIKFTSAAAVTAFLPQGGTPAALTADLVNPTSSSAGVFGGQVLALRLNAAFSQAGVTQGAGGALGGLKLTGTGTSLDGLTVNQLLAVAESALGGGALPADYTIANLNDLVTRLNEAFDNGTVVTLWATLHLTR
ncbi:MAG: Ig family protein [Limisphaerales bacterium]|nr:MAG: Ig family protein [Limisphaerales bacterium]KAG0507271.1 MAG: Ig family protein [Limisphaerales bacterium]TXT46754.1 MAG: Ig family protein [Limisphaerales bacterium]